MWCFAFYPSEMPTASNSTMPEALVTYVCPLRMIETQVGLPHGTPPAACTIEGQEVMMMLTSSQQLWFVQALGTSRPWTSASRSTTLGPASSSCPALCLLKLLCASSTETPQTSALTLSEWLSCSTSVVHCLLSVCF